MGCIRSAEGDRDDPVRLAVIVTGSIIADRGNTDILISTQVNYSCTCTLSCILPILIGIQFAERGQVYPTTTPPIDVE